MTRTTIPHGGVVKCEMPGCAERFTTYSVASMARQQALNAGWARISGKAVRDKDGHILSTKLVDLCPKCKPAINFSGPDVAK